MLRNQQIPNELLDGGIRIGKTKIEGEDTTVYWPANYMEDMHKILVGPQRAGKTTYLTNFVLDAIKKGESIFVLDYIKDGELSNNIVENLPEELKEKVIILDLADTENTIPLNWNEITNAQCDKDTYGKLIGDRYITSHLGNLLQSVLGEESKDNQLPLRIKRYLSCASQIVFSVGGTNIVDVFNCIIDHTKREEFIKLSGLSEDNVVVKTIRTLDITEDGKTITDYTHIEPLLDRISLMLQDPRIEKMFFKKDKEIDFRNWADNGYCVLIKVSELEFSRRDLKVLVTMIYSKLWLTMLSRINSEQSPLTHLIIDEFNNFPQLKEALKLNLREASSYGLSFVLSNHLLYDIKELLPYIKGSASNFMMFKPVLADIKLMEDVIKTCGLTIEECKNLKDFNTLNLINYDRDYTAFISKLPEPANRKNA